MRAPARRQDGAREPEHGEEESLADVVQCAQWGGGLARGGLVRGVGAPRGGTCVEVVAPLRAFVRDLGLTRARAWRQLDLDVPRSEVRVDGVRVASGAALRGVPHPALCTQAVLAPAVEWLVLRAGLVVAEPRPYESMRVHVAHGGRLVDVHKRLALVAALPAPPDPCCDARAVGGVVDVAVRADADRGWVSVGMTFCLPGRGA